MPSLSEPSPVYTRQSEPPVWTQQKQSTQRDSVGLVAPPGGSGSGADEGGGYGEATALPTRKEIGLDQLEGVGVVGLLEDTLGLPCFLAGHGSCGANVERGADADPFLEATG